MLGNFLLAGLAAVGTVQAPDSIEFERDVRPILENNCFSCHGPHARRIRANLMMTSLNSLVKGGDSGQAVVPGDPDSSLLMRMVRYENEDFQMPPTGPLDPADVDLLERWIRAGADWPEGDGAATDTREISMDDGRQWWAFRPVTRPAVPELSNPAHVLASRNGIDAFIFAIIEAAGLQAAPQADERSLVRRVYLDLLGIQPKVTELNAYLEDQREDKWTRLIDRLLSRSEYGERWGRYWLDVVRFAQTNGYERDEEKQYIWRYRDYVIDSFNADKPYDQFLREQLAGDELDDVTEESLIATGFYGLGVWDTEPNDPEQAVWDAQDDILRTITEGMMAVSVGCARCHDHRFDPIRQRDYYSMLSFVRNVQPYEEPSFNFESRTHRLIQNDVNIREEWARQREAAREDLDRKLAQFNTNRYEAYLDANFDRLVAEDPNLTGYKRSEHTLAEIAAKLRIEENDVRGLLTLNERTEYFRVLEEEERLKESFEGKLPWMMTVAEASTTPVETHVLRRGQASSKLAPVTAGFLPVLCEDDFSARPDFEPKIVAESPNHSSSGQRLALANWIANPKHPTTARVMVNRIWQGHFGQGLVATPDDFGASGEPPSHPLLLDWLADEFVTNGWSVKYMHRLILHSETYRRRSTFESDEANERDPGNRLLWRQNMRRLDAEALRDSILAVCGMLNPEAGGRGFFPALSLEALSGASRPGGGWGRSSGLQRDRRAVYAYVKRGMLVPFLTVFDSLDPSFTRGKRPETTVASQALTLLNGAFTNRAALQFARKLLAAHGRDLPVLIRAVYRRVVLREPSEAELDMATAFVQREIAGFETLPLRATFRAAVPKRLEMEYLRELSGADCLSAPRKSWISFKGNWGNGYNKTVEAVVDQGPFGVLRKPRFSDGLIALDLTFDKGCERVDLLLRMRLKESRDEGLRVIFDVASQELRLVRNEIANDGPIVLSRVACELTSEVRHTVRIRLQGQSLSLTLDRTPRLSFTGSGTSPNLIELEGRFGIGVTGAAAHVENLRVKANGTVTKVNPDYPGSALERAMALFCLTALNLNEFLYID